MFEVKGSNGVSRSALVGIWLESIEDYIANVLRIRSTGFLKRSALAQRKKEKEKKTSLALLGKKLPR